MMPFLFGGSLQPIWDLDATQAASYSGTGSTWNNLITSPDDGQAQSAYNFTVEGSPVFTGSAGTSGAYWAMDGTGYFQIAGGNTPTLNQIHQTGGSSFVVTIALAFATDSSPTPANLFGTESGGAGCTQNAPGTFLSGANGFNYLINKNPDPGDTNYLPYAQVWTNGNFGWTYNDPAQPLITASTDTLVFCTMSLHDYDLPRIYYGVPSWVPGDTHPILSFTNTNSASGTFCFGNSGSIAGSGTPLANGSKLYGCYGFNKAFEQVDYFNFINTLNSRQGNRWNNAL